MSSKAIRGVPQKPSTSAPSQIEAKPDLQGVILAVQANLASTYQLLGRLEEALPLRRYVYSVRVKLLGEENGQTLGAAFNCATTLKGLSRFEECKALLRKTMPVTRRVLGESNEVMLKMKKIHALALVMDDSATLDDFREAVTTLEDTEPIARRVLGGSHPLSVDIESDLRRARAVLHARETTLSPPARVV